MEAPGTETPRVSMKAERSVRWRKRAGLSVIALGLLAAVWFVGLPDDDPDDGAQATPAAALWTALRWSIQDANYNAFLACFTPELQAKLGRDETARRRFGFAVDGLRNAELTTGTIDGDAADGRLRVQILGTALPTAIGMPAEPESGLQLDLEHAGGGWLIADARPTEPMKQPGGDPVGRAANSAVLTLVQVDRLAAALQDAQLERLTAEERGLVSEWLDEIRAASVPPDMGFVLDPERFDAETRAWSVDVAFRSLATKLGAPATRLALVLGPVAGGGAEGGGVRYRIVESRLILR